MTGDTILDSNVGIVSQRKDVYRPFPNLATWRDAHKLNQREAAKLLGVSQSLYGRLERKERTATGNTAKRIMEVARVPLESLVGLS